MQRSIPAEVAAVLQSTIARSVDAKRSRNVSVTAVDAVVVMPYISRVGNGAEPTLEGNTAVNVAAQVGNRCIAEIGRIDTLGQERERMKKIQILGVVVEPRKPLFCVPGHARPAPARGT